MQGPAGAELTSLAVVPVPDRAPEAAQSVVVPSAVVPSVVVPSVVVPSVVVPSVVVPSVVVVVVVVVATSALSVVDVVVTVCDVAEPLVVDVLVVEVVDVVPDDVVVLVDLVVVVLVVVDWLVLSAATGWAVAWASAAFADVVVVVVGAGSASVGGGLVVVAGESSSRPRNRPWRSMRTMCPDQALIRRAPPRPPVLRRRRRCRSIPRCRRRRRLPGNTRPSCDGARTSGQETARGRSWSRWSRSCGGRYGRVRPLGYRVSRHRFAMRRVTALHLIGGLRRVTEIEPLSFVVSR
ncbi:hypothetical protein [Blastococcus brunescens]|uniref:Uncharacterized protein n=1 Tax=Blastococcus brunescens TaxID=1564165 RepID=A0ABZ1B2C1_9ACTN|nr:hypothetical protein [Blastococcus sp. BMG 8361]WRL63886.1 hypothetical protein U6N30_30445 [Blastococcus sp. BMG 8361]